MVRFVLFKRVRTEGESPIQSNVYQHCLNFFPWVSRRSQQAEQHEFGMKSVCIRSELQHPQVGPDCVFIFKHRELKQLKNRSNGRLGLYLRTSTENKNRASFQPYLSFHVRVSSLIIITIINNNKTRGRGGRCADRVLVQISGSV